MMKHDDWINEESIDDIEELQQFKKQVKVKKRKWREIESYKEKQRLRHELQAFDQYIL